MSTSTISRIEPTGLWQAFDRLNAVPRPSKHEERISQFMVDFGHSLGLETEIDSAGNVLIRKPAFSGRESHPTLVLQAHLDMVHQKNADTSFDFASQGIAMVREGDWVRAQGTTLGADNGIGVAAIMAVLADPDLSHPAIEALFTIDEETGMTGAKALQPNWLQGRILLNLDTEDDHELTIGCAGGVDVTGTRSVSTEPVPAGYSGGWLKVRGLTGGHSGMDIHLGRANANKLMNRLLWQLSRSSSIRIHSVDGGSLRNAIPRESTACMAYPASQQQDLETWVQQERDALLREYAATDPELTITFESAPAPETVLDAETQSAILNATYALHNGIFRMSPAVPGLVQTSNNLARVLVNEGQLTWACLTRSSVDSERDELARSLQATMELAGARVELAGDYPGWQPAPGSQIVALMSRIYRDLFGDDPKVAACHAGLECGIIGAQFPGMEMVSFGPNIRGAHSPDEKVQISSVEKFWKFLTVTLQEIR